MVPEELIAKVLSDNCTEEERNQLNEWISQSSENKKLHDEFALIWKTSGDEFAVNEEEALQSVHCKLGDQKKRSLKSLYMSISAIAAVLLVGVLLFFFVKNPEDTLVAVSSGNTQKMVSLPDGSAVWLNKESSLSYPENLDGRERTVSLVGEAYFEVAKNPEKPFVVSVNGATVTVLGTAFNIKSAHDNVTLSVTEGRVSFAKNENKKILVKGHEAELIDNAIVVRDNYKTENFLAWKTKKMSFNNIPLGKIANELSNYFGISIQVKDSSLAQEKLKLNVTVASIEESFDMLHEMLGVSADSTSNGYIIRY